MNLYIFDCFGVVVSDVSTLWMKNYFTKEEQDVIRREVYRKLDCGLITFSEMFEIVAKRAGISSEQVRREWDQHMYLMQDTVDFIDQLRQAGHQVVLLSNAAREYIDELFTKYDLYKHFDKIFVSASYGCAKPDREFYQICLDGCTKSYQNIYFTDDNPANLQGLETLGITPILFTDAASLKKTLGF